MASAGGEIAAINEHQGAIAEPDHPAPRRIHDLMLTDLHTLARAVAEVLHDDSEAFPVGARVHPHRHPDGAEPSPAGLRSAPTSISQARLLVCCCLMRN